MERATLNTFEIAQAEGIPARGVLLSELEAVLRKLKTLRTFPETHDMIAESMNQLLREDLQKLKNHYGTYRRISQVTGVSHVTLHRIMQGGVEQVKRETFKSIEDCVKKKEEWNVKK